MPSLAKFSAPSSTASLSPRVAPPIIFEADLAMSSSVATPLILNRPKIGFRKNIARTKIRSSARIAPKIDVLIQLSTKKEYLKYRRFCAIGERFYRN